MVDIERRVRHIASELGLSVASLEERFALFELQPSDVAILKAYRSWTEQNIDDLVEHFWDHLQSFDCQSLAAGRLDPDRVPELIGRYLTGLFESGYDQGYLEQRIRVGVTHQHIGIPPGRFIGALSRILTRYVEASAEIAHAGAFSLLKAVEVLHKVFLFDIGLVLEVYTHAEHHNIEQLAKHDGLTGLPNHNLLHENLKTYLSRCDADHPLAVMFIGLNSFKAVNETLGHDVGDIILKDVASRLMGLIPPRGIAARVGGDIFVMLAPLAESADAKRLTQRVLESLNEPLSMEGFSVDVSATVGVVLAHSAGIPAAGLMSQAEMALYHAKRHQLTSTTYSAKMKRYSRGHLGIGTELRRAIDQNELVLLFQPKVAVASRKPVGVEALLRWLHPFRGLISPGQFIPLAEKSALIHPLTDWVINAALKQVVALREQGHDILMSVNLAAPNLQNFELPDRIGGMLAKWGLDPGCLVLEITESSLMVDPKRAHDILHRLRSLGAKLSIDDFGTGYSSLAYLKDLPVNEVKIDRAFIFGLCANQKDERIVRATIQLGHSLGLEVTAEGVEDEDTLQLLGFFGCDTAQGYYMSEPLPADALETWLKEQ